jgi:3-dehydroquinate dehydratase-1
VKICGVVLGKKMEQILSDISIMNELVDLIEIRFDYSEEELDIKIIKEASKVPLIATNRCYEEGGMKKLSLAERIKILLQASEEKYHYVDLELETSEIGEKISRIIENGSKVIGSHHDFVGTPTLKEMEKLHLRGKEAGANIVKIIGTARKKEDNLVYLTFNQRNPGNVSFGMGGEGVISRVISPLMGAAFTYASLREKKSAPGQLSIHRLKEIYKLLGVNA